jgi:uncharacterized protein
MRTAIALSFVLVLVDLATAADPYEDAMVASRNGDFIAAAKLFLPLAESGNADAQVHLAEIYYDGLGVPTNYNEAVKWFRRAADQGKYTAQYQLSGLYAEGRGVAKDDVIAMMWLDLVAAQGYWGATDQQSLLAKEMTPDQIAQAKKLADEWKPVPVHPVSLSH